MAEDGNKNGGGGLCNFGGTMTVTDSTVSGNETISFGDGGGIRNDGGTLAVTGSTISGNSAYQGGGILAVKKVAALCEAAGVPCVFHCAHDLGLKTAAMLHVVASTPGFTLANDCTYYGLEDDIITPLHRIEGGFMPVPEGPGLGVSVDEAKLAKYRV